MHDFGTYRDYSLLSQLSLWFYANTEDVQLETQIITSENHYYFERFWNNFSGWFNPELPLNPAELRQVGIPDLAKIRYLKIVISNPAGDSSSGKVFLAPISVVSRSLAEQR